MRPDLQEDLGRRVDRVRLVDPHQGVPRRAPAPADHHGVVDRAATVRGQAGGHQDRGPSRSSTAPGSSIRRSSGRRRRTTSRPSTPKGKSVRPRLSRRRGRRRAGRTIRRGPGALRQDPPRRARRLRGDPGRGDRDRRRRAPPRPWRSNITPTIPTTTWSATGWPRRSTPRSARGDSAPPAWTRPWPIG